MKGFIQDNGGILAIAAVAMVIAGSYMEWRISVNAAEQISTISAVTPQELQLVVADLNNLKTMSQDLKATDVRIEQKIDNIIRILLEDD